MSNSAANQEEEQSPTDREYIYMVRAKIPVILVFVDSETNQPIDYQQDSSDTAEALIFAIQQRRAMKQRNAY